MSPVRIAATLPRHWPQAPQGHTLSGESNMRGPAIVQFASFLAAIMLAMAGAHPAGAQGTGAHPIVSQVPGPPAPGA